MIISALHSLNGETVASKSRATDVRDSQIANLKPLYIYFIKNLVSISACSKVILKAKL
jgi:hypothetical protein